MTRGDVHTTAPVAGRFAMSKRIWLLIAASLIFVAGATWWIEGIGWRSNVSTELLPVEISTPDEQIRDLLLAHTPVGSDALDVLRFVVDDLAPRNEFVTSYHAYIDAVENIRNIEVTIARDSYQAIGVAIGSYSENFPLGTTVFAKWVFDERDKLTDVVVSRMTIGP